MSFNPNDNNLSPISRNNYEEYLLLYADDELNTEERLAVENFLLAHPDLQQELNLLLAAKLPVEHINLENKEGLMADSMKVDAIDEALLLYIDNELSGPEKNSVEEKLKTDTIYQLQYNALLCTKVSTPDKIVYPYKKQLYQYEVKNKFSFYWIRIAAAVVILLGMGVFVFTYEPKPADAVAVKPEHQQNGKKAIDPADKKEVAVESKKETETVQPTVVKVGEPDVATDVIRNLEKKRAKKENKTELVAITNKINTTNTTKPTVENNNENKPEQKNIAVNKQETPQQILNNPDVTPRQAVSFNDQTTSPVIPEYVDVVKTDNEKKSSLKGFLRKATRFIERRTNISTTNENDELLIGAVALKL